MTDHTVEDPRTGAERYFAKLCEDPEYLAAYRKARARIDATDEALRMGYVIVPDHEPDSPPPRATERIFKEFEARFHEAVRVAKRKSIRGILTGQVPDPTEEDPPPDILALVFDALDEAKVDLTEMQSDRVTDAVLRRMRDEGYILTRRV